MQKSVELDSLSRTVILDRLQAIQWVAMLRLCDRPCPAV